MIKLKLLLIVEADCICFFNKSYCRYNNCIETAKSYLFGAVVGRDSNIFPGEKVVICERINKKYDEVINRENIFGENSITEFENIIVEDTDELKYITIDKIRYTTTTFDKAESGKLDSFVFLDNLDYQLISCNTKNDIYQIKSDTKYKLIYRIVDDGNEKSSTEIFYEKVFLKYKEKFLSENNIIYYFYMWEALRLLSNDIFFHQMCEITKRIFVNTNFSVNDKKEVLKELLYGFNKNATYLYKIGYIGMVCLKKKYDIAIELCNIWEEHIKKIGLDDEELSIKIKDYKQKRSMWFSDKIFVYDENINPVNYLRERNKRHCEKKFKEMDLQEKNSEEWNDNLYYTIRWTMDCNDRELYEKLLTYLEKYKFKKERKSKSIFFLLVDYVYSTSYPTVDFNFKYGLVGVTKHRGFDNIAEKLYEITKNVFSDAKDNLDSIDYNNIDSNYIVNMRKFLDTHKTHLKESEDWVNM